MPVTPTYPGVYIEEISNGVRTISGVATSITAFIGRALRGATNDPIIINNYTDFERLFGGLRVGYPMSYAVRDFYLNGGSQALILRLFRAEDTNDDGLPDGDGKAKLPDASDDFPLGDLKLEAANPGAWGNTLSLKIDYEGIDEEVAKRYDLAADDLFNITVVENPPRGRRERIINVSLKENAGSRRLDRILEEESQMVRVPIVGDAPEGISDSPTRPGQTPADRDPTNPDVDLTRILKFTRGTDGDLLQPTDYQLQREDPANPNSAPIPKTGLFALDKADLFNLLCIPPESREGNTDPTIYAEALKYCVDRRAMLIVDPPAAWGKIQEIAAQKVKDELGNFLTSIGATGPNGRNAALYFPRVVQADSLRENQQDTFVPCGIIAGIMARTDTQRGVWKAPAGIDAGLTGIRKLQVELSDPENGILNPLGVNCLRNFPPVYGRVVWGARTLRGADQLADEYKYVPVRRLLLFLQESLYRGTQWVVFEPNDEPLWAQIRLNIGVFMNDLFRQGAFQGKTPREAYFVKCDRETTTQSDINRGIVNIIVGFAPLKPAEFVIIKFQQIAGQLAV